MLEVSLLEALPSLVVDNLGDFLERSYRFVGAQGFAPFQNFW